jgi:hypothetical protein
VPRRCGLLCRRRGYPVGRGTRPLLLVAEPARRRFGPSEFIRSMSALPSLRLTKAIRRPSGDHAASVPSVGGVGQPRRIRAVRLHHVDLGGTVTIARERDLPAVRRPGGGGVEDPLLVVRQAGLLAPVRVQPGAASEGHADLTGIRRLRRSRQAPSPGSSTPASASPSRRAELSFLMPHLRFGHSGPDRSATGTDSTTLFQLELEWPPC